MKERALYIIHPGSVLYPVYHKYIKLSRITADGLKMKLLKMLFNIESCPDITIAAAQIRPSERNCTTPQLQNSREHKQITKAKNTQQRMLSLKAGGSIYEAPAMLRSRISCRTCSTLWSKWPCAYCSRVSGSKYCCTCAIREYASAQTIRKSASLSIPRNMGWRDSHRSCILTSASNDGSRYGTRRSMSWGISVVNCSFRAS
jgi:hypothetical protein